MLYNRIMILLILSICNVYVSLSQQRAYSHFNCVYLHAILQNEEIVNHFFLYQHKPDDTLTLVDTFQIFNCNVLDFQSKVLILDSLPNEVKMGYRSHKNLEGKRNRVIIFRMIKKINKNNYELLLWQVNDNATISFTMNFKKNKIKILYKGVY